MVKTLTTIISFLLISLSAQALQIDEKLTLRVIKHSNTKKTLLINRGIEDGLAVGDHAKFFLTTGVVARAVIVKVSPSRSIWSVYRLIDGEQVNADKVMNLKISSPVKLTADRSKMLSPDPTDSGSENLGIALAPGADDTQQDLSAGDQQDLASLAGDGSTALAVEMASGIDKSRTLELWGLVNFSALSASSDQGDGGSTSGSDSSINFSAGLEKYFTDVKSIFYKFSIFGLFHYSTKDFIAVSGSEIGLTAIEYGLGVNWHFLASPFSYNRLIGFLSGSMGLGKTQEVFNTTTASDNTVTEGSSSFFSVGVGAKYFHPKGFGARVLLDFYRRAEQYVFEEETNDSSKIVQGPRMQVGISYRW